MGPDDDFDGESDDNITAAGYEGTRHVTAEDSSDEECREPLSRPATHDEPRSPNINAKTVHAK